MKSKLIMGSALSIAAIAVAIDHTKHQAPEPQPAQNQQDLIIIEGEDTGMQESGVPCGLSVPPCSL